MRVIMSIAGTTIGEAIRRKVLLVIFLIGLLFVAIAPGLKVLSARSETSTLISLTMGILQLTSALIAIVLTVYLIPNEIDRRTIYTILCKPVQRYQFLLGKYFGAVGALGLLMSLMTLALVLVFYFAQPESRSEIPRLVKLPIMYFVQMSLLAAVAIMFSTFVTPLVNFFLTGGTYLVGTLLSNIFESLKDAQGTTGFAKTMATIISVVLPNFNYYNVQNPLINPGQQIQNETFYYLSATGYGILYISILLIVGMIIFDRREV